MKKRYIIGGLVVLIFLAVGGYSFLNSSIEYATISKAENSGKKVQVTGKWVKEMDARYDSKAHTFTFYMRDEENRVAKVVLTGGKPNNFDIATSIVAKGRYEQGAFHASEVLTKCPSKYEGKPADAHPDNIPRTSL
ncbi:MAG: cytochrome c maturation protein CcmE [Ignavibacteriae bacterium]|nr:cytochrome c maturation protein CcmE [Ignavibacteriota bacterium]